MNKDLTVSDVIEMVKLGLTQDQLAKMEEAGILVPDRDEHRVRYFSQEDVVIVKKVLEIKQNAKKRKNYSQIYRELVNSGFLKESTTVEKPSEEKEVLSHFEESVSEPIEQAEMEAEIKESEIDYAKRLLHAQDEQIRLLEKVLSLKENNEELEMKNQSLEEELFRKDEIISQKDERIAELEALLASHQNEISKEEASFTEEELHKANDEIDQSIMERVEKEAVKKSFLKKFLSWFWIKKTS